MSLKRVRLADLVALSIRKESSVSRLAIGKMSALMAGASLRIPAPQADTDEVLMCDAY